MLGSGSLWAILSRPGRRRIPTAPEPPALPRVDRAGHDATVEGRKGGAERGAVTSSQDGGDRVKKLCSALGLLSVSSYFTPSPLFPVSPEPGPSEGRLLGVPHGCGRRWKAWFAGVGAGQRAGRQKPRRDWLWLSLSDAASRRESGKGEGVASSARVIEPLTTSRGPAHSRLYGQPPRVLEKLHWGN
ncbi:hypothetical protein H8959_020118 [Pygathrix nigripes]